MNSPSSIGGYFELELPHGEPLHPEAIAVNSARSGFEYLLRAARPKKVYLSKYTCEVMLEPLLRLGVDYEFYGLNERLEIEDEISVDQGELLVYVNYFGVKSSYTRNLSKLYGDKLLVDGSQSLYYKRHNNESVIYSPRKFVGVSDGGYIYTNFKLDDSLDHDVSYGRISHLVKRIDLGAENGYEDFKTNDASLSGQPLLKMSKLTSRILESIDHDWVSKVRRANFLVLNESLGDDNLLNVSLGDSDVPMIYPFMTRDASKVRGKLIENKVFAATYWPNVFQWSQKGELEYSLARDILALPIDQRYDSSHMKRILEIIDEC